MVKVCIFDLDGTLGDTRQSLVRSVEQTLARMGLPPITEEQCISFVGNGARRLMEKALAVSGPENISRIEEAMEVYGDIFDKNCTYGVRSYEGIHDVLEQMNQMGIKLAVLSNKPHRQTEKVIKEMFGNDTFAYVQGQKETIPRKPDKAAFKLLMERFGVSGKECLYVGDSEVDVAAGKNAGIKTISVSWGFRTKEELKAAGAEYIIDKAGELLQYMKEGGVR